MRKATIILIGLLFMSLNINAQLIIISTRHFCDATYNEGLSKWNEWKNYTDTEITIKVDLDNNLVKIDMEDNAYKLLKLYKKDNGTDTILGLGNYTRYVYNAVDKKGDDCVVMLQIYDRLKNIVPVDITIAYADYKFNYIGSKVEF
jgi:hypothetical protein